jgi:hypothetical protein
VNWGKSSSGSCGAQAPYCWKPHRAPPTILWSWMKDKRRKSGRCTVNRWLTTHTCIGARAGRGGRWGDGYVRIGRRERSPYLQFWICHWQNRYSTFSHNKSTPTPPSSQAKPIQPASGWCWFVLWEKVFVTGVWCWFVLREKYCWLVSWRRLNVNCESSTGWGGAP